MRIVSIEHKVVSIASEIRNAYIDFSKMTVSVVKITTDVFRDGQAVVGYGFNSNGRYAQAGLLDERFIPRLLEKKSELSQDSEIPLPERAWDIMMAGEKPGGHGERSVAVGVLDMALWDVTAKLAEKPLNKLLVELYGEEFNARAKDKVFIYAAGGYYYPNKDLVALQDEMRGYLDLGYSVVKMKIGGGDLKTDLARIEAVLEVVGDGQNLAVDANGRYDLQTALAYAEGLEPYNLRWYEEIGDPLDYRLNATICEAYPLPIATGENLFSHQDARNLIRYGGMRPDRDILQMDPVLSYGLTEYLRTLRMLKQHGWSPSRCIPHGGHQFALNIASAFHLGGNEAYPKVFAPFGGLADSCPIENSLVSLPDVPGIGFETNQALYEVLRS